MEQEGGGSSSQLQSSGFVETVDVAAGGSSSSPACRSRSTAWSSGITKIRRQEVSAALFWFCSAQHGDGGLRGRRGFEPDQQREQDHQLSLHLTWTFQLTWNISNDKLPVEEAESVTTRPTGSDCLWNIWTCSQFTFSPISPSALLPSNPFLYLLPWSRPHLF